MLELFGTTKNLATETVLALLIADLIARNELVVLILDDYHEIQVSAIHGSLEYLLEHLPDNLFVPERGTGFAILANGTDLDRDRLIDILAQLEW